MMTLVVYDIEPDPIRKRIADACLDSGLQRIQYSVFLGQLSHNHKEELVTELRDRLGEADGVVVLFDLSREARRHYTQIGEWRLADIEDCYDRNTVV